ncbi:MAG: hypothetical protein K2O12_06905, partial [Muribaculaceae bacterium]|nr:hypothetical protein [Muribaculaceae bacterium]
MKKVITVIFCRIVPRLLLAVFLLLAGLTVGLYSPWVQDGLKNAALHYLNRDGDTEIRVDRLRLRFPLRLQASGVCMLNRQTGDTLVYADAFYGSVRPLPLLKGDVDVSYARVVNALYVTGSPDSAMYLRARIGRLDLEPARVGLGSPLSIDIENATLADSRVSIDIRPDTAATDAEPKAQTAMVLKAGRLRFVNFAYEMSLSPAIDSIGASFGDALLSDAVIDLSGQTVDVKSLKGTGLNAAYIASASVRQESADEADDGSASQEESKPWTVRLGVLDFDGGSALYTTAGHEPEPGMDFGYISADSLRLRVEDFYNQSSVLRLPIARLSATERCGLSLEADGLLRIDGSGLHIDDFTLDTPTGTSLDVSAVLGMGGDMTSDPDMPLGLNVKGNIDIRDAAKMFPIAQAVAPGLPDGSPIEIEADASGTTGSVALQRLDVRINRCVEVHADGTVAWPMNASRMGGDINISGRVYDVTGLKNKMLDKALSKMFNIPPMTVDGHVSMASGDIDGRIRVLSGNGSLAASGAWKSTSEGYVLDMETKDFPVDAFLPSYGVGDVTAGVRVKGSGLNPLSAKMHADASFDVASARYSGYTYRGVSGEATVDSGHARIALRSDDPSAKFDMDATGNLVPEPYEWNGRITASNVDLM